MRCPSCGSENSERAPFCTLCFWPLEPGPEAPSQEAASTSEPVNATEPVSETAADAVRAPSLVITDPADSPDLRTLSLARTGGGGLPVGLVRFAATVLVLVIPVAVWALGGGWGKQQAAEIATVPVPTGAQLIATHEGITEGLMGPLDEERQDVYATRVFLVPLPLEEAMAYYRDGGTGSDGLTESGWDGPTGDTDERTYFDAEWSRWATMGPRAEEEQLVLIRVQEQDLGFGVFEMNLNPGVDPFGIDDPAIIGQVVPGQSCLVMIACVGPSLEELAYPEK